MAGLHLLLSRTAVRSKQRQQSVPASPLQKQVRLAAAAFLLLQAEAETGQESCVMMFRAAC